MSSVFEPDAGAEDAQAEDARAKDAGVQPAVNGPAAAKENDPAVGSAGFEGDRSGVDTGPAVGSGAPAGIGADPVLLVTVYDPVEAEIIVGKLRSAKIEAYARHDAMSVVYGLTVDGFGQQDILVRPEDLADARVALEEVSQDSQTAESTDTA